MNVLLVTTWDTACGIAEHSAMLKEYVEAADPDIQVAPDATWLDPTAFFQDVNAAGDTAGRGILHLNYHAALHSRWEPQQVTMAQALGFKVVITFHDTVATGNADKVKALCGLADAFVVHEPVEDLPGAVYWRQGVLPLPVHPIHLPLRFDPWVGTCGFDFPWKNFDLLAEASCAAGWGVHYVGGNLSLERKDALEKLNPRSLFGRGFRPREEVASDLSNCDATAFLYTCHNTGTSGAVRMGIAARKPMILMRGCRQFRDLELWENEPGAVKTFRWSEFSVEDVTRQLRLLHIGWMDPRMVYLAEQDGWPRLGKKYAQLYREVLG
jgi:hypothetical protein